MNKEAEVRVERVVVFLILERRRAQVGRDDVHVEMVHAWDGMKPDVYLPFVPVKTNHLVFNVFNDFLRVFLELYNGLLGFVAIPPQQSPQILESCRLHFWK